MTTMDTKAKFSKFTKNTNLTTSFEDFEFGRLSFTQLEENSRSNGQLIGYVRYNCPKNGEGSQLNLQCPWMKLFTYGIPRQGPNFETDDKRAHIRIPFDEENEEQVALMKKLQQIDEYLSSDEFKQLNFGKKASKYKYSPIVRVPEEEEDDDGNVVKKAPFFKVKIKLSWPDKVVETNVYTVEEYEEDGKKKWKTKETVECKTIDEMSTQVKYLSSIRPIIRPFKVWALNAKVPEPKYGLMFKVEKVQVQSTGGASNKSYKEYYQAENDAFLSDSEDEKPVEQKADVEKVVSEPVKEKDTQDSESDSESDSDSDSDSESEEEEEVKPKKKAPPPKGKGRKVVVDA
jgi:hypothetical protein